MATARRETRHAARRAVENIDLVVQVVRITTRERSETPPIR
jgi:hypothetical protein